MFWARFLTILLGVPVLLGFVYLGGYWFALFVLLVALIGLKEYNALMRRGGWKPVELTGYFIIPMLLAAVYLNNPPLLILFCILIFALYNLLPVFFSVKVKYWESVIAFWGIIYTGGLAGFLLAARLLPGGFYFILFLLIVIWCNDIFAYLLGSRFGRRLLVPSISPKKTIEGMAAGLSASVFAGIILSYLLPADFFNVEMGAYLGLLIGITGSLGDLSQSALKRSAGAKDSGDLLPGHGGILDRFDSLFFAAPFFYMYIYFYYIL